MVAECVQESDKNTSVLEFTVIADFNRGPRPDFESEIDTDQHVLDGSGQTEVNSLKHCFNYEDYHTYYNKTVSDLEDSTMNMWKNPEKIAKWFFHLSYLYLSFVCLVISLVVGLIVSICTGLYEVTHPQHHQRGLHGVSLRGEKLSGRLGWLYNSLR